MDKWTCSECTMRNAPHLDYCHECASPRRAGAHLGSGSARPSNQAAAGMNDSIASFGSRNDEGHSSSVRPFPGNMGRGLVGKKGNAPPSARAAVVESSMIVDDFGPEDSADDFDQDADGGDDDNDTTDADFDRGGLSLSQSSPGSGTKRKRRSKEQIEAEKSAKAAAKAAKAAAKSAKLAGVLAQKEAKANARAEGGSFQNQEIAVVMSDDLLLTQTGQVVANELMKEDYAIFSAAKPGEAEVLHGAMNSDYRVRVPPVPRGIFWVRRRIDPLRPVGKGKAHGYLPGITREPFAARVWVDDAFIAEVTSHGTDGLEATLDSERAQLPSGTRMLYLVQGAKAAATAWSQAAHREKQLHDAGKLARAPRKAVNNDMLDYAVLYLYVSSELEVKETVNDHETAEQVVGLTRAIAQMPYRASESALGCVTKVKASGGPGATAGEAKKAAWDVWVAQLQMIPSASDKKARAIATKFPSFRALADAYADPARSELEKQELLSDIFKDEAGKGSKQSKLSRDVYRFFTTDNPDEVIGSGGK